MELIPVLLDEFYYVACIDKHGSCIIAWMDAHESVLEILVHVNDYILFFICQYAERSDCSAYEPHLFHKVFFGGECERTCILCLAELLEVDLLVFEARDEVVLALLVITDEKVFGDLFRMRQIALEHFVYRVDRLVFDYLIFYLAVIKDLYYIFLCKCHFSVPFLLFTRECSEEVPANGRADVASDGAAFFTEDRFTYGLTYLSADGASRGSDDLLCS